MQRCVGGEISILENLIIDISVHFHSRREQISWDWVFFTCRIVKWRLSWLKFSLALIKLKCFILILTLKLLEIKIFFRTKSRCNSCKALFSMKWHCLVSQKQFSSSKLSGKASLRRGVRMESYRSQHTVTLTCPPLRTAWWSSSSGQCHPVTYTALHSLEASCISLSFPTATGHESVSPIISKIWGTEVTKKTFLWSCGL